MDKENIKGWLGCLLWIIGAVLLFKGFDLYSSYKKEKRYESYIENRRNDSIRKAFVKDSLMHDPRYQDSLRKAEEEYKLFNPTQRIDSDFDKEIRGLFTDN